MAEFTFTIEEKKVKVASLDGTIRYYFPNELTACLIGGEMQVRQISQLGNTVTIGGLSDYSPTAIDIQTLVADYNTLFSYSGSVTGMEVVSATTPSIPTRPTDYNEEVAIGLRDGVSLWNKFGYNNDIDVGTEFIAAQGGLFTRIDTATTFTISSSSNDDTSTTGIGAWNLVIYYIDEDRVSQIAVVPLTGTTPVVTSVSGLGINRAALYNTGSEDINVGNITITATTGGSTQAFIPSGTGTTQQCIFFTQSGHSFLVDWLLLNVNKSGGGSPKVTIKGWVYSYVSNSKYLIFNTLIDTSVENHLELSPNKYFVVGEKSIFWFEATTDTNNTYVSCRFSGHELSNN